MTTSALEKSVVRFQRDSAWSVLLPEDEHSQARFDEIGRTASRLSSAQIKAVASLGAIFGVGGVGSYVAKSLTGVKPLQLDLLDAAEVSAGPLRELLSEAEDLRQHFAHCSLSDDVVRKYEPRLITLAKAMRHAGLSRGIAYQSDDDEVTVEFGKVGRTLSFTFDASDTVAMFRSGLPDDFSSKSLAIRHMGRSPSGVEYDQVARNYLMSLVCPITPNKLRTFPTAILSVVA